MEREVNSGTSRPVPVCPAAAPAPPPLVLCPYPVIPLNPTTATNTAAVIPIATETRLFRIRPPLVLLRSTAKHEAPTRRPASLLTVLDRDSMLVSRLHTI